MFLYWLFALRTISRGFKWLLFMNNFHRFTGSGTGAPYIVILEVDFSTAIGIAVSIVGH